MKTHVVRKWARCHFGKVYGMWAAPRGPSIGFDSGHTKKKDSITAARSFVALVWLESALRSTGQPPF